MDTWPIDLLWPSSVLWRRTIVKVSGGSSISEAENDSMTDGGGKWACDMTVSNMTVDQIKLARAMIEGSDGGTAPLIVPYISEAEAPYPLRAPAGMVPFSDEATFSDGSEFVTGAINITASAANLRSTQLTVSQAASSGLVGGECYSIVHPTMGKRLYTIIRVPLQTSIRTRPPLREAIPNVTRLDFDKPACVMKLVNATEAMQALRPPYMADLNLQFVETLDV